MGLTLAGRGDDEPEDPFAATTTAPILLGEDAVSTTTTATTAPPTFPPLGRDPFAVPGAGDAITDVYVEAALDELARLDGTPSGRSRLRDSSRWTPWRAALATRSGEPSANVPYSSNQQPDRVR